MSNRQSGAVRRQNRHLKRGGSPGRPKGSKDKVPRTVRGSLRAIFQQIADKEPTLYRDAVLRGLKARGSKSFPFVQLAAHYVDGKPKETVEVHTPTPIKIVMPGPGEEEQVE